MNDATMRVGELARRTGLTVRTLHHYDEIGLLVPSERTDAGHRRYTAEDIARLQQIASLRSLGLSLDAIRAMLDEHADPLRAVEQHLAHLRETLALQQQLVERLEGIAAHIRAAQPVAMDDLLHTIHLTTMFEKHYTPEQLEQLKRRREEVGEDRIREAEQHEWPTLWAAFREHMEAGTPPDALEVQALARRAEALLAEFTGGDAGIRRSLNDAVQEDRPSMYRAWGIDEALGAYYGEAMGALRR